MSFQQHQARFNRLQREHAAWQLLCSDNAAYTLAFVADIFKDETQVSFVRARAALDAELELCREQGLWEGSVTAAVYLRQWIQMGWLRELDDNLCRTDACEIALRFAERLDQRESHATASHLRIVQDTTRELALALTTDIDEKLAALRQQQVMLQRQIDELESGVLITLDEREQSERVRELYQLAAVLTGDFRRLEDEIRELDQAVRVRMIESANRGDILSELLEQENLLATSEAGRAFEGFFELLMDQDRSVELREQLRAILNSSAAQYLSVRQARYLNQLMRELSRESDRVFAVRRRTEENLRLFIERGALQERRIVDQLLTRIEHLAVTLRDSDFPTNAPLSLTLASGHVRFRSVSRWQLYSQDAQMDTTPPQEHANDRTASDTILAHLNTVSVSDIAFDMHQTLQRKGPQTVGQLVSACARGLGLEELVGFMRVAHAVHAAELPDPETVTFSDGDSVGLKASIPRYMLSAQMFPDKIEDLAL